MAQFDNAIAIAKRLITKFGETATIYRRVDGTPNDADKDWEPGDPTETPYTTPAVWLSWERNRIDGQLIKEGDQRVLVPAVDLAIDPDPSTDEIARASGERWAIVGTRPLSPNGQRIMFELHVRR